MAKRKRGKKKAARRQTKKPRAAQEEVDLGIPWPDAPCDLETAIELVEQHAAQPFGLAEIVAQTQQHVRLRNPDPRDHIRSLLGERPGLARVPDQETYVPARLLFRDAAFLIAPTEQEIEAGVLVPGHRFYPFLSESVSNWS